MSNALAKAIGHAAAHELVAQACRRALEGNLHLREVVRVDEKITAHLSSDVLNALFDPQQHVHAAARLVDQALAAAQVLMPSSPTEDA